MKSRLLLAGITAISFIACQNQEATTSVDGKVYPYIDTITEMSEIVYADTASDKLPVDSLPVRYRIKHFIKDSSVRLEQIPTDKYYLPKKQ
jgi:hypothetical protein